MNPAKTPHVPFVYYTYTKQTGKIGDTMSQVLRDRGCDAQTALIEFTDPKYKERFNTFPMPHPMIEVVPMLLPELRRATGEIKFPKEVLKGNYDLVVIGSPTWWLSTSIPIRSFLQSADAAQLLKGKQFTSFVACRRYWRHNQKTVQDLGTKDGGKYIEGIHFTYEGGQVRSLMSLVSYLGSGVNRERFLGVKIPPTNLQPYHIDQAKLFATGLADKLTAN